MPDIRIAIVEDDREIRNMLEETISSEKGFHCDAVYENAEDALRKIPSRKPDVVLMDINLPGMNGIECVRRLIEVCPGIQVMMCTVYEEDEKIFNALLSGATGYIVKKTSPGKLVEAIRELHEGGSPMSASIARRVVSMMLTPKPVMTEEASALTAREKELLHLLSHGYRYKEIAEKLSISIETVRRHTQSIYRKLHVQSRTDAINKAFH
jgi:DNA-binding NarL/FixJ family response regulator